MKDIVARPGLRISAQMWLALLALGLALWLFTTYASVLIEVVGVVFAGSLLALAIDPMVDRLARERVPRWLVAVGVYVLLVLVLALLCVLIVPSIQQEVTRLQSHGPDLMQSLRDQLAGIPWFARLVPSNGVLLQNLTQRLDALAGAVIGTLTGIGKLAIDLVVMLAFAFFLVVDDGIAARLIETWVPASILPSLEPMFEALHIRLARWVVAQAGIALYFAIVFSIGLLLLGVPFAVTIGVIGGVLEIIPYLGGFVAVVLAILSALTVHPILVLWVVLYYVVVTLLESHVIAPTFYGRVVGLHPALVLVVLLFGAKAGGIIGALLAVPIAVVLGALVEEIRLLHSPPDPAEKKVGNGTPPHDGERKNE